MRKHEQFDPIEIGLRYYNHHIVIISEYIVKRMKELKYDHALSMSTDKWFQADHNFTHEDHVITLTFANPKGKIMDVVIDSREYRYQFEWSIDSDEDQILEEWIRTYLTFAIDSRPRKGITIDKDGREIHNN